VVSYRLTPRARDGLAEILDYTEREFGVAVAQGVLDRIASAFDTIARNPNIGALRPDITDDVTIRFWTVAPSLLAYRRLGDVVEILFIERGERDWARVLREDS
jgi:plasmid stabilization system protein ParE